MFSVAAAAAVPSVSVAVAFLLLLLLLLLMLLCCFCCSCCSSRRRSCSTVDQFNKKRVLLPQTLDIPYSGVHGNKKFPTVEGPEVVR